MTLVVIAAILSILLTFFLNSESQPSSTIERTRYSGQLNKTDWHQDDLNWVSNQQVLIEGLEQYYQETGIQPYVFFQPYDSSYWNADGSANANAMDAHLEKVYDSTFTDEAHFIFAYFSAEVDSKQEMEGEFRYLSGYSADTIMDSEALKIFWGYFQENYYDTSLNLETMIANTFADTATRIMSRPTNVYDTLSVVLWVAGGVAVVFGIVVIVKLVAKRRREQEEYNQKILETPLETFGSQTDTSELEKKYQETAQADEQENDSADHQV